MRTVVGVLRGGPSSEYEVSLRSGASVLGALDQEKYEPRDLFVSRDGQWHLHGVPVMPERALRGVDAVFNVIHGEYGEDGRLHEILDAFGIPYTGSSAFVSKLVFDKQRTKEAAAVLGVKVAHGIVIDAGKISDIDKTAQNIFRTFPHPAVVKPLSAGSSVGVTIADSFHALARGLELARTVGPKILIEEYIPGREATVGVIDDFRNEKLYALMPVEIIPPQKNRFFSYDAKYSGETVERVPGNFTREEKEQLISIAKKVHEGLGLSHYSRSDFIVSKRGLYFLEVNSAAAVGLSNESLLPKALHAGGTTFSHFLDHVINLARRPKNG
ncbi:MAG TPA: ATP-grasp domain-containing protein [Candidatus Paceibacterota bacterium]